MNHENQQSSYHSDGLPAVPIRMFVRLADSHRVIERALRGFKAQAVIALVGAVLRFGPYPFQTLSADDSCNYGFVATRHDVVKAHEG